MIAEAPGQTTMRVHGQPRDQTPSVAGLRGLPAGAVARLNELLALGPGWDGNGARRIDQHALAFAARAIDATTRMGLPDPEIFPVPSGGVQLEWTSGDMELEFEIEPGVAAVVFVGDDRQSARRFDGVLPDDQALFLQALANLAAGAGEHRPG